MNKSDMESLALLALGAQEQVRTIHYVADGLLVVMRDGSSFVVSVAKYAKQQVA